MASENYFKHVIGRLTALACVSLLLTPCTIVNLCLTPPFSVSVDSTLFHTHYGNPPHFLFGFALSSFNPILQQLPSELAGWIQILTTLKQQKFPSMLLLCQAVT